MESLTESDTESPSIPRIIALWSAPRSRSTVFARMFAERGDYEVVHEPFSHVKDFGEAKVGDLVVREEQELIAALRGLAAAQPVFFKDTTDFHYPGLLADAAFLRDVRHTFIIRHPAQAIASHFALNPRLERDEIGFAWLAEIYDAVTAASGHRPVVIDSDDLVDRPDDTVRAYCRAVGVPFVAEAMSWTPGMLEDWRKTSRWHQSTSASSRFVRMTPAGRVHPASDPRLAGYLEYHLPYYEQLRAAALRP
jgi:hypothetical protein